MEIIKAIEQRRSIRKFQNKEVSREILERLLELAIKAPSGKNRQPWRFVVLQGEKKSELVKLMKHLQ
jgi:nitroreductase